MDVSCNYLLFLSCIGLFDQWLIGGPLDGCVAIRAGKTHVRCVHVYITTSEQGIRQDIYNQEDTDILRLSLK